MGRHRAVCDLENRKAQSRANYDFFCYVVIREANHVQFDRPVRKLALLKCQVVFPRSITEVSISCPEAVLTFWLLAPWPPGDRAVRTVESLPS